MSDLSQNDGVCTSSSSSFDYIYQQITLNGLSSDLCFAFLELFWPTFILHDSYILLKNNFSESKVDDLKNQNEEKIEYWMNLFTVDPYFEDVEEGFEKAAFLSKKLVEIWQAKLKIQFPNIEFVFESFVDEETGDCGLTFYQKS